jgi:hypothetical protein
MYLGKKTGTLHFFYIVVILKSVHRSKTWSWNWAEPLHERSKLTSIIKKVLVHRRQKHVHYGTTRDSLVNKREQSEEPEAIVNDH